MKQGAFSILMRYNIFYINIGHGLLVHDLCLYKKNTFI